MELNSELFACIDNSSNISNFSNMLVKIDCSTQIGDSNEIFLENYLFLAISALGFICSIILLFNICIKRKKHTKNFKKGSMRKLFQILPILDLIISIYWLLSNIFFNTAGKIYNFRGYCSIMSLTYLSITTFYFCFMCLLLKHFRKIHTNPIEGIIKTKINIITYLIISIVTGGGTGVLAYFFNIVGRSPLITCFINTELSRLNILILIIPITCIILTIVQILKGIFCSRIISCDEKIKKLYRKNALNSIVFIILHCPMFTLLIYFGITNLKINNINVDNIYIKCFIFFTTLISSMIPFIINLLRLSQGLIRCECCIVCCCCCKKKKTSRSNRLSTLRKSTMESNFSKDLKLNEDDKFDWLDQHAIEFFMRDILIGIAYSIEQSMEFGDDLDESFDSINYINHNINFLNFDLNDDSIKKSTYLDVNITEYAPKTFAYLRLQDGLNIDEMINSFLPMNNSVGISKSKGKSGSFFISTDDNKYMIKTLKKDEFDLLKNSFVENYLTHINHNPNSLLCRLYGLYKLTLAQGDEFLIIVMRNVIGDFKDNAYRRYDVKGSTHGRSVNITENIKNLILKDENFVEIEKKIFLKKEDIQKFHKIIKDDSNFLKKQQVMDYSLFIIKINLTDEESKDIFSKNTNNTNNTNNNAIYENETEANLLVSNYAENNNMHHDVNGYKHYLFAHYENKNIAYILSIIDYLQFFNLRKRLEFDYKTKVKFVDETTLSCVNPNLYAKRFVNFLKTIVAYEEDFTLKGKNETKKEDNLIKAINKNFSE